MAARTKTIFHPEEVKRRIQTSQLINRLTAHALSAEGPLMDASQVQAARALIDKVIPNAKQQVELTGNPDAPIVTRIEIVAPQR